MDIVTAKKYRKEVLNRKYPSVDVTHTRIHNNPKGGMTAIRLWIDKGCVVTGVGFCWEFDTYNKRKGKSIAFGRLMRVLYLSGAKGYNLRKWEKLIRSKIGILDEKYASDAYNGDKIT